MVDGIFRLMQSDLEGPANIGCPEYVTVEELARTISKVAGKEVLVKYVEGPVGVLSRNFSNEKIYSIGWEARFPLEKGIALTYPWVAAQVEAARERGESLV